MQQGGCSFQGPGTNNANDCTALRTAYLAFNQQPASWTTGFLRGTDLCTWDPYVPNSGPQNTWGSIGCDATGRVNALNVFNAVTNGGVITPALSRLDNLNILAIALNNISGTIPPALMSRLTKLYSLNVAGNVALSGNIPENINLLRNLSSL